MHSPDGEGGSAPIPVPSGLALGVQYGRVGGRHQKSKEERDGKESRAASGGNAAEVKMGWRLARSSPVGSGRVVQGDPRWCEVLAEDLEAFLALTPKIGATLVMPG